MMNQIKKQTLETNPLAEGSAPPKVAEVHVQTLDPFASSFKADDAVNYD